MNIDYKIQEQILILILREKYLDAKNASTFKDEVFELIRTQGLYRIILDLSYLNFMDSSALRSLLIIQKFLITQGGSLKLACANTSVHKMLEISAVRQMFGIFNTIEEAIRAF